MIMAESDREQLEDRFIISSDRADFPKAAPTGSNMPSAGNGTS